MSKTKVSNKMRADPNPQKSPPRRKAPLQKRRSLLRKIRKSMKYN